MLARCLDFVYGPYEREKYIGLRGSETYYNTVTCRVLVLLTRSGSWRERDIIISFRGDLDSTGSCSQIVRLFSTV